MKDCTMTILIVEDDAGISILLNDKLIEYGYETFCALSAAEALAWLKDQAPDLMILDYSLPDMNGIAFIGELNKKDQPLPEFIVTTGLGDEYIAVDMMKLGARDYIIKNTQFLNVLPEVVKRVDQEIKNEKQLKQAEDKLRESAERLSIALESANSGIWDWYIKTGKVFFDANYFTISGYEPDEFPHDYEEWKKRVHPDDIDKAEKKIESYITGKAKQYMVEFRFKTRNNDWMWILSQGKISEYDDYGNPVRFTGTHRDISGRRQLEEQLRRSHKMESIGTIAGGIAHDFNNILYMITGNAELALEDITERNPAHDSLKEIMAASLRGADIVKQLLNFSRKTDQKLKPIGIVPIIKDTLKFIRSILSSNIEIRSNLPTADVIIFGDPVQISQIIINISTNAFQAMEETGGIIEITAEKKTITKNAARSYPGLIADDYLKIAITDTGPGIDPENTDKIFDPYFTTREPGKGSGMGLAIVHGIIKNHNGVITVDSKPGKGTTFTILFPLVDEKPATETEEADRVPRGTESILFVDDEGPIVNMAQKMLKRLGYQVKTKLNPAEALELFQTEPQAFDLVITDMTMPQMSGVILTEKLRDIRPDIPVIISTGHSSLIDEEKTEKLRVNAYVMKPIVKRDIARTIRKVLDETQRSIQG